ncbi:MAG: hypothetical protein ACYS8I_15315 [Planctomycetota bacterium]|jgi:hypothetical protein
MASVSNGGATNITGNKIHQPSMIAGHINKAKATTAIPIRSLLEIVA